MTFATFGTMTFNLACIVDVHDRGDGTCAVMLDTPSGAYDAEPNKVVLSGTEAAAVLAYFNTAQTGDVTVIVA